MFISAGGIIGMTGSFGAAVAYAVAGLIVGSVMYCLCEMVTARPLTGALISYPHQFVDPALGFAVAVMYWWVFGSSSS